MNWQQQGLPFWNNCHAFWQQASEPYDTTGRQGSKHARTRARSPLINIGRRLGLNERHGEANQITGAFESSTFSQHTRSKPERHRWCALIAAASFNHLLGYRIIGRRSIRVGRYSLWHGQETGLGFAGFPVQLYIQNWYAGMLPPKWTLNDLWREHAKPGRGTLKY